MTGTPAFFDGANGVRRLQPLEQRLHVDFGPDPAFDSSRAVQIRLPAFEEVRLLEVGQKVRHLYPSAHPDRVTARVGDEFVTALARQVAGKLGGKVGVAPRLFLKKLVGDVLDRVDEHEAFDPRAHYKLDVSAAEMSVEERVAAGVERSVDEIELDLSTAKQPE
jgi:hypothetical protein